MRRLTATACLCLALSGNHAACSAAPSPAEPGLDAAGRIDYPERVPEKPHAITGEVPDHLMQRIRSDLGRRTGAEPASFEEVTGQFREWPTGAMGCPQPGEIYTQQPVRGYRVVLEHDGREYDYRTTESGIWTICEPRKRW